MIQMLSNLLKLLFTHFTQLGRSYLESLEQEAVHKLSAIAGAILLGVAVFTLLGLIFTLLSILLVLLLWPPLGIYAALLLTIGVWLVAGLLLFAWRRQLIDKPLQRHLNRYLKENRQRD